MQNITSHTDLKTAIQLLEIEQKLKEQILKDQLYLTVESLKPHNVLKSALKDVISTPDNTHNLFDRIIGSASGFFAKKIVVGGSENIFRKLIGYAMQYGVKNYVTNHTETIKSVAQFIFQFFTKNKNSENQ